MVYRHGLKWQDCSLIDYRERPQFIELCKVKEKIGISKHKFPSSKFPQSSTVSQWFSHIYILRTPKWNFFRALMSTFTNWVTYSYEVIILINFILISQWFFFQNTDASLFFKWKNKILQLTTLLWPYDLLQWVLMDVSEILKCYKKVNHKKYWYTTYFGILFYRPFYLLIGF